MTATESSGPGNGTERVNVALLKKASAALEGLVTGSASTKTEAINRAIIAYAFFEDQLSDGCQLILRDRDGNEQRVHLL
ncbi:hypothetical protein [Phytohabitans houttuyneae]|nr:hypothetical protein [Phytohabitans houttuyneae]